MKYSDFVDYSKLDPFKERIVKYLAPTFANLARMRIRIVQKSIGEPAALLDFLDYDFMLAFKSDGVGTKNKIADEMIQKKSLDSKRLYSGFGIDLIAMNANDLLCLGATPIALSDEVASGDSSWFEDEEKVDGLLQGFKKGCDQAGITIPCGETPTIQDIIYSDSVSITGSMIGIVKPKSRVILGEKLQMGDIIYGLASNGIHANGLTLARKIVESLPEGYFIPFGNKTLGEELLKPTRIYVKPILEMLKRGIEIHYMSNITGSAFKKIMRAKKRFTYSIEKLPRKPKIFKFLQEKGKVSDFEAYQTWNMGVGFVIFAPGNQQKQIAEICQKYKIKLDIIGYVKKGLKRVIIKPLNIIYGRISSMANQAKIGETSFSVGDTVGVSQKIIEGGKTRTQPFEGIVIAIRGRGENRTFTVRKIAAGGIGAERIWPLNSPWITKIKVKKKGKVRRAKLYYLRGRVGKKATRIKTG